MNTNSASTLRLGTLRAGLATLATLCGLVALTSPAQSADEPGMTTVVKFYDLDPVNEPGAKTLHARLRFAARKVCSSLDGPTLRHAYRQRACIDQAIARAVEQIDIPALTTYHLARTGRTEATVTIAKSNESK